MEGGGLEEGEGVAVVGKGLILQICNCGFGRVYPQLYTLIIRILEGLIPVENNWTCSLETQSKGKHYLGNFAHSDTLLLSAIILPSKHMFVQIIGSSGWSINYARRRSSLNDLN